MDGDGEEHTGNKNGNRIITLGDNKFERDFTAVFLVDVHIDSETEFSPAWIVAKKFVRSMKPDKLILGGDFADISSLSTWETNKRGLLEGRRYGKEIKRVNKELDGLSTKKYQPEITYLMGNHEDRVARYLEVNPELEGVIGLEENLHLEDRGILSVPVNKILKVGYLNMIHGWYTTLGHARKTLIKMGGNVIYGHVHRHQVECMKVETSDTFMMAMSCGSLADLNPFYARNHPNDWTNSFIYIEFRRDGTFNAYNINILDGVCTFGGKTWSAF